jgi:hypothetical protein
VSQKVDRKELRKPDQFQVRAGQAMDWMIVHQRQLLLAIGALVVIAVGAGAAAAYASSREAKAGAALSEALELNSRPIAGEAPPQPGVETFPSKEERQKALIAALEKVRTDRAGTTAAMTATAEVGFQKLKAGDPAGATQPLQQFLGSAGKDHPLRMFATESLGYALEGQGKLEDARTAFAKLTEAGAPDRAAYQAARLALVENKPDAKAALTAVAKEYPKEPVAMEANQRLELASMPPVLAASAVAAPAAAPAAVAAPSKPAAPAKPAPKTVTAKKK